MDISGEEVTEQVVKKMSTYLSYLRLQLVLIQNRCIVHLDSEVDY